MNLILISQLILKTRSQSLTRFQSGHLKRD